MPTYEYRCKECGEHLEVVQAFTDDPLTECPNCGGPLRKVFGQIGITFKGSGFYKTDSRSKTSAGSNPDSASDSKSETAADSKPEKKADSKPDSGSSSGSKPDTSSSGSTSDSSSKSKSKSA